MVFVLNLQCEPLKYNIIMEAKFYKCPVCGNVMAVMVDSGVVPVCCGKPMTQLNPMEHDGALEKHVPVVTRCENGTLKIKVGETPHPMTPEHHIAFIAILTAHTLKVIDLEINKPASVVHRDCHEDVVAVYEYCNLHGLWKATDIPPKIDTK